MKTGLWQGSLLFGVAIVSSVLGVSGCKAPPECSPITGCGGPLITDQDTDFRKLDGLKDHEWVVTAVDSNSDGQPDNYCQDQLQTPPTPLSLLRQPPVQATDRPPDKVTADWCYNIVFKPSGEITRFIVWAPPIPLKVGLLTMSEDFDHNKRRGTYSIQITYAQTRNLEFSETCLTSQGIRLKCPELGRRLGDFLAGEANIYNVRCFDPGNGAGGCNCLYDLTFIGGPNGRWDATDDANPTIVTFFDDLFNPPVRTDYCSQGANLDLMGHDNQALFNQRSYRWMKLQAPSCSDGIQSHGELGVDCGGVCAAPCGTCTNGVKDVNEEGIDCGGVCLGVMCDPSGKASCNNGAKEPWEEGVDCGGPCKKLCTQ